ncbi:PapD-like protein [Rickenella mellea]|uniref:PapD-like protein n=1 Tax=Rickenella mellea TaxID=50990 RepID=A0A4Y7PTK8_9AGAM|nr:PapD-like protein [Rickenella mellea]
MSVHLTPNFSLGFARPLAQAVKRTLIIKNNSDEPVAYKVETTANVHVVKDCRGRLLPGHHHLIQVSLQAMKDEPPLDTICNDKIIVKSTAITPEKLSLNSAQIWESLDVQKSKVHQQEIKIVYVPSPDQNVDEGGGAHNRSSTLTQGDSRHPSVRSVPEQPGARAVESEGHPLLVSQPVGDASIISELISPLAPVAPIASRRRIWTFLKRLIHSRSTNRKDREKPFTPVATIPPIDRKIPPPAYCSVAVEHFHDDKPPHLPPSLIEHAPNFTPTAYAVAQAEHKPQPEVKLELREQLAQAQAHLRTLLASVPDHPDAPAVLAYLGDHI